MFTFGIFSTHLPYIAFVLFYGFFFLAGIEKAAAGELDLDAKLISQDHPVMIVDFPDVDDDKPFTFNSFSRDADFEQLVFYGNKLILYNFSTSGPVTKGYCYSWFSRPPPVN